MKVLLTQSNSHFERTQQTIEFNQQWKSLLLNLENSIELYDKQIKSIQHEDNSLIDLDTIQVNRFLFQKTNKQTQIVLESQ